MQHSSNSSALAMELLQSYAKLETSAKYKTAVTLVH